MTNRRQTAGRIESAVERGLAYALLARCLAHPDDENVAASREAAEAAGPFLADGPVGELAGLAAEAERSELEPGYVQVFTLSASPDCPNFETAFFPAEPVVQTARMADIAGFYLAFGVDVGGRGLRPDDISVELEFMAYLCRKQVYASEHLGAAQMAQAVRAQRLFLREHLGQWGVALGRRVALRATDEFYREAGLALAAWLAADCEALRVAPKAQADAPSAGWEAAHATDLEADEAQASELNDTAWM